MLCPKCDSPLDLDYDDAFGGIYVVCNTCDWAEEITETTLETAILNFIASLDPNKYMDNGSLIYSAE